MNNEQVLTLVNEYREQLRTAEDRDAIRVKQEWYRGKAAPFFTQKTENKMTPPQGSNAPASPVAPWHARPTATHTNQNQNGTTQAPNEKPTRPTYTEAPTRSEQNTFASQRNNVTCVGRGAGDPPTRGKQTTSTPNKVQRHNYSQPTEVATANAETNPSPNPHTPNHPNHPPPPAKYRDGFEP